MKIACITGATSGIGRATALALAEKGYQLIITGRRAERLDTLAKEIKEKYDTKIFCLSFDVRNQAEVEEAFGTLPKEWKAIDVLVNNAGLAAGLSHLQDGVVDDWNRMIDTNIKGLLYVTRTVAPFMVARHKGHIINISSIAGLGVYEMGNVYCATKHAVEALTQGMRIDMLADGIRVTSVRPGMVETEFSNVRFSGDDNKAKDVYRGVDALRAEDIADAITYVVCLPERICINEISVLPTQQASVGMVSRKPQE